MYHMNAVVCHVQFPFYQRPHTVYISLIAVSQSFVQFLRRSVRFGEFMSTTSRPRCRQPYRTNASIHIRKEGIAFFKL